MSEIIFTHDAASALRQVLEREKPSGTFLLYPSHVSDLLTDSLAAPDIAEDVRHIPLPYGEQHKNISATVTVWEELLTHGATRRALIVNLGGGMTTDLGGFAAACYMRGIRYVNIPTTLLACVDASAGGKTGVNLRGVKNIVGAFHEPVATIVSPQFLKTLPDRELLSGWGEMLKHALLMGSGALKRYLREDPRTVPADKWLPLIEESVAYKRGITEADPKESGLRRILNLGHTVGHALETYFNSDAADIALSHGHAVAFGLVTALVLSHSRYGFPSSVLQEAAAAVRRVFPPVPLRCDQYKPLLELMHCDKKNRDSGTICFVLMSSPGNPVESVPVGDGEITAALDITRELLGV